MKVSFMTSTVIEAIEASFRSLWCINKERPPYGFRVPGYKQGEPCLSIYKAEGNEESGPAMAYKTGESWVITTPRNSSYTFTPARGGMKVLYEGAFMGLGASPFIPALEWDEIFSTAKVESTLYRGSLSGYLEARLDLIRVEDEGRKTLDCWRLPAVLENKGWSLWMSYQSPVKGFEKLWPGVPPRIYFADSPIAGELDHVRVDWETTKWKGSWNLIKQALPK